ncbi:MAG: mechanosensitive ion channel family protein [Prochlorococcaceae cyanobacterium]
MNSIAAIATALGLEALLLAVLWLCRRRKLPPIPVRMASLAILIGLLAELLPANLLPAGEQRWIQLAVKLSQLYAGLQLASWIGLELPARISWWLHPPKILRDLLLLLLGSIFTVVLLQQQARVNLVGLVTTSAVLTAVVGLAAQEALKDFFAGILLQLESPFREGDYIELGENVNGWVISSSLMSTRIQHVHGALINTPNSKVWEANIRRWAPLGPLAREIHFTLDRNLPPAQATALLLEVARQHPLVLQEPAPEAFIYAYADHGITYELEVWQQDPTDSGLDVLRGELLAQIWYALERIGQRAPYPVRELQPRRATATNDGHPASMDSDALLKLLKRNVLFKSLEPGALETIAPLTRCLRYAPGESVVCEGDEGNCMYQVVSGTVEVLKRMEDGSSLKVAELGEGTVLGEMSVFNDEPRSATVKALTECLLLEIERNDLRPVLEGNPVLLEQMAQLVGERVAQLRNLDQAARDQQNNQLLTKMRNLFASFTGN